MLLSCPYLDGERSELVRVIVKLYKQAGFKLYWYDRHKFAASPGGTIDRLLVLLGIVPIDTVADIGSGAGVGAGGVAAGIVVGVDDGDDVGDGDGVVASVDDGSIGDAVIVQSVVDDDAADGVGIASNSDSNGNGNGNGNSFAGSGAVAGLSLLRGVS